MTALLLVKFFDCSPYWVLPVLVIIASIDLVLWGGNIRTEQQHRQKTIYLLETILHNAGGKVDYKGVKK